MKTMEPIFVGIKGSVVALDRATGTQVWATRLKGCRDFVNLVVEDDVLFATTYGEIFCLNPVKGNILWHNPLKGFGTGPAMIASKIHPGTGQMTILAEKRRRDEQAAAAAAASVVVASA